MPILVRVGRKLDRPSGDPPFQNTSACMEECIRVRGNSGRSCARRCAQAKSQSGKARKLEKPSSKDLRDKPGNTDLGGNSDKDPGEKGRGRSRGVGYGVATSGDRERIVGSSKAMKFRKLEKPSSKDLRSKPGNTDLGGNSGKDPGEKGRGRSRGVGYGVASRSYTKTLKLPP